MKSIGLLRLNCFIKRKKPSKSPTLNTRNFNDFIPLIIVLKSLKVEGKGHFFSRFRVSGFRRLSRRGIRVSNRNVVTNKVQTYMLLYT